MNGALDEILYLNCMIKLDYLGWMHIYSRREILQFLWISESSPKKRDHYLELHSSQGILHWDTLQLGKAPTPWTTEEQPDGVACCHLLQLSTHAWEPNDDQTQSKSGEG